LQENRTESDTNSSEDEDARKESDSDSSSSSEDETAEESTDTSGRSVCQSGLRSQHKTPAGCCNIGAAGSDADENRMRN
jgi:hypothetical protein